MLVEVKGIEPSVVPGLNRMRLPVPPHSVIGIPERIRTSNFTVLSRLRLPFRHKDMLW